VFMGATWSGHLRNMMLASFAVFLAALALLVPVFGNAGLWGALHLFLLARGLSLATLLPKRTQAAFAGT